MTSQGGLGIDKVLTEHIADGEVSTADIGSNQVTAAKVAADVATQAELDAVSSSTAAVATGTYTGDGSASQSITGLGFQPQFVWVFSQETTEGDIVTSTYTTPEILDDTSDNEAGILLDAANHDVFADQFVSLDADGFTVTDGTNDDHPNQNNQVYNWMAIG